MISANSRTSSLTSVQLPRPSTYHCFTHQQALDVIPWGWQKHEAYNHVSPREKQGRCGHQQKQSDFSVLKYMLSSLSFPFSLFNCSLQA